MKRYKVLAAYVLAVLFLLTCGCARFIPEDISADVSDHDSAIHSQTDSETTPQDTSSAEPDVSSGNSDDPNIGISGSTEIPLPIVGDTVVSFAAFGNNLIHPSVCYTAMEYYAERNGTKCDYNAANGADCDFRPIYEHVADVMKNADICFVNQETLSGGDGAGICGYPLFNSPEAVGIALADLGADVINMAHNHMLDAGNDSYLIHSDRFFTSLGMTPLGYYEDKEDTDNIVIYEEQGVKFAWLTYTYSTNGITCYSKTYIPYFEDGLIRRQVALAKERADAVIVSAHWGSENTHAPNSTQKYYASLFCELGVDVVIGTHSNCLQPMQWMTGEDGHRMLLTYSLGNFVSGMQNAHSVLEGMLTFNVRKDGETEEITIESPVLTPLVLHYEQEASVNSEQDTGCRKFKLYELKDYTEELLAKHGVHYNENKHGTSSLHGGGFSIENMYKTVRTVIPAEFLPEEYK